MYPAESTNRTRRGLLALGGIAAVSALVAPSSDADDEVVNPLTVHGIHNLLEFGSPANSDEERLRMAIANFVTAKQEVTIMISRAFSLTSTLVVDTSYISLEFTCGPINATTITSGPAVQLIGSSTSNFPNTRSAIRGLRLLGPGKGSNATGMLCRTDTTTGATTRGVALHGLEIIGFGTGISLEDRCFLISFYNFHVSQCGTGIDMPSGRANYGENVRFIGGGIGTSDLAIHMANVNGDLNFHATSLDFCKQAIQVDAGIVSLVQSHIEINETGANSTTSQIITGSHPAAQITIIGGRLFFHTTPKADFLFETQANGWGGGIQVDQLSTYNTTMKSGYLVGGTGKVRISQMIFNDGNSSGAGQGSIMTFRGANKLIDGGFDLGTVADASLIAADATSRTASASMELSTSGGNLVMKRKASTSGPGVVFDVPVTAGLLYAIDFTIAEITATGTLYVSEGFIGSTGRDQRGIETVVRSDTRPNSSIALAGAKSQLPFRKTFPQTSWNRVAPAWATHFRVRFSFSSVAEGTVALSEMIITEI